MGFLPKLWKEKFKGKVGHVPVFAEDGTLVDSGKEPGGGGSLTPEDLTDVLKGSDDISVDINQEGTAVVVKFDEDKRLYRHDINMYRETADGTANCTFVIISNRNTAYDFDSLIAYFQTHYPFDPEATMPVECTAITRGNFSIGSKSYWVIGFGLTLMPRESGSSYWLMIDGSVSNYTTGSYDVTFGPNVTEVYDTVNQLL